MTAAAVYILLTEPMPYNLPVGGRAAGEMASGAAVVLSAAATATAVGSVSCDATIIGSIGVAKAVEVINSNVERLRIHIIMAIDDFFIYTSGFCVGMGWRV